MNPRTILGGLVTVAVVLVLAVAWLQYGGAISAWSAGVYKAVKGNQAAEQSLKTATGALETQKAENTRILEEYIRTQETVRVFSQQIQVLNDSAARNRQVAQEKDRVIAQLQGNVRQLETERSLLEKVKTLKEAHDALGRFNPAYR